MNSWVAGLLVLCNAACHGCESSGGQPSPASGVAIGSLAVTSRAFASGGAIPIDLTCDGADRSPALTWSAPPPAAQSFAIVADDPDAPGGTYAHWVAYNLRADAHELPEGADPAQLAFSVGTNDFNRPGYGGPCPPHGEMHHYAFRVYALDTTLDVAPGASRGAVLRAMNGHVLAEGVLVGVFSH
jgi:Raf kinase inhibitor-like YbhB/YbcL family protein